MSVVVRGAAAAEAANAMAAVAAKAAVAAEAAPTKVGAQVVAVAAAAEGWVRPHWTSKGYAR